MVKPVPDGRESPAIVPRVNFRAYQVVEELELRSRARETRVHGREAELAVLHGAWQRALEGEGNTVFLEGEVGIGKTRLPERVDGSEPSSHQRAGCRALRDAPRSLILSLARRLREGISLVSGPRRGCGLRSPG